MPRRVHARPVETRFGPCLSVDRAVEALAEMWGVAVAPSGGWCANRLGMIAQAPICRVYLTSGPDRRLCFNRQEVQWRRAPRWQLVAPKGFAGAVILALAWLGPLEAEDGLAALERRLDGKLPAERKAELAAARAFMPSWMTGPVGRSLPARDTPFQSLPTEVRRRTLERAESAGGVLPHLLEKDIWIV